MALAETAQLVADLTLRDHASLTAGKINRSIDGIDSHARKAGRGIGVLGTAIGTGLGVGLERAVSGGIRSFIGAVRDGVGEAQELQNQQAQTTAAIKSTGGAAGVSAQQVRDLAEKYEGLNATIDDKVIQSAENMLLTFTNVDKKAFQPALEAALNMNTRFGGGPEGLQSTMVQVGKALQDPVRGVTALRRVGVQLTDAQEKQVKTLVKNNDLYGAQKIVLGELNKEFGGSFLAEGGQSAAKAAKFTDALDDMKRTLAEGLLPGLDRVRDRLSEVFSDPQTLADVKNFGTKIADFLTVENIDKGVDAVKGLFGFLKGVPWSAIAGGLSASASATKAVVDAFLKLPPQVQTAIITGVAVNKLSGGMLGNLAGQAIGKGAGSLLKIAFNRGDTPANPMFVAPVGGSLGGAGGVAGAAGAGGKGVAGKALGILGGLTLAGIVAEVAQQTHPMVQQAAQDVHKALGLPDIDLSDVAWPFGPKDTPTILPELFGGNGLLGGTAPGPAAGSKGPVPVVVDADKQAAANHNSLITHFDRGTAEANRAAIIGRNATLRVGDRLGVLRTSTVAASGRIHDEVQRLASSERADARTGHSISRQVSAKTSQAVERMRAVESASRTTAARTAQAVERIKGVEVSSKATAAHTDSIRHKNFSPNIEVGVNVDTRITVNSVQKRIVQMQRIAGRGFTATGLPA